MPDASSIQYRRARQGDGAALYAITEASVAGLARDHYPAAQIDGWMDGRSPVDYDGYIAARPITIAELAGRSVGFVDSKPGEILRLFVLPEAAGKGIGGRLLEIGLAAARIGHEGPVRLEATLNAEAFYQHHGFRSLNRGSYSHGPTPDDELAVVIMEI